MAIIGVFSRSVSIAKVVSLGLLMNDAAGEAFHEPNRIHPVWLKASFFFLSLSLFG